MRSTTGRAAHVHTPDHAGLISALAFSTDPASGLYAAGSYTGRGSVCLYTEDTGERSVGELDLGVAAGCGVTQVCVPRAKLPDG